MRNMYQALATQYDPLGMIIPFSTRVKVLIQQLWAKKRDWDDPNLPLDLLDAWSKWEKELPTLSNITLPRMYASPEMNPDATTYSLHVFCDASEQAYGSVAYLTMESEGKIHVAFVMARSGVAPRKQLSMPRLELCGALTGAQLSSLLHKECPFTESAFGQIQQLFCPG